MTWLPAWKGNRSAVACSALCLATAISSLSWPALSLAKSRVGKRNDFLSQVAKPSVGWSRFADLAVLSQGRKCALVRHDTAAWKAKLAVDLRSPSRCAFGSGERGEGSIRGCGKSWLSQIPYTQGSAFACLVTLAGTNDAPIRDNQIALLQVARLIQHCRPPCARNDRALALEAYAYLRQTKVLREYLGLIAVWEKQLRASQRQFDRNR